MRWGSRVSLASIAIVLAAVSMVASQGRARGEEHFDPSHPVWHWQGPFEYVRDFGASAPGCSYHGREMVQGEMVCAGTDLRHLRCTATGAASHDYDEQQGSLTRKDSGSYQGPLQIAYDTHQTKGVDLFRLDAGANLPVRYRQTATTASHSGGYLLDVAGSTGDLVFEPETARLERRRVQPIYEPGPPACGVRGQFNGTETVSMRLLPTD